MWSRAKRGIQNFAKTGSPFTLAGPEDVERAEWLFYLHYLRYGMIAFDVGANVGDVTLLFSRFVGKNGQVHSFEAVPKTFERLNLICKNSIYSDRAPIFLNEIALSNQIGTATFNLYEDTLSGMNTMALRPLENYGLNIKTVDQIEVPSITLDKYCQDNKINTIDLLKLDTEGSEFQILLGAETLLKNHQIKCCIFEFGQTTFDMGNSPEQIQIFLNKMGYTIKNIIWKNPKFPGGEKATTAQFSMMLATPQV